jgi:hypothetical protein
MRVFNMQHNLENIAAVTVSLTVAVCLTGAPSFPQNRAGSAPQQPRPIEAARGQTAAPGVPSWADSATVPGNNQVRLNWRPASGTVIGYCLRYRTSNSSQPWTAVANLPPSTTAYTVTGLNNLQSYEFQVGAADAAGNTTWNAKMHARPRGPSHPSGLHGGGQVNAIVSAGGGNMVAGGDVAGFQRSLDGGETWFQSSRGIIRAPGSRGVASLAYHRASGTLYGACGECFYKSTDNAATWTLCHSGKDIAVKATGKTYPRPVGKLIAADPANVNTVYLGTVNDGIKRSVDGGVTWTALALGGKTVRSLVLDRGFLYAAVEGEGVYRCTTDGSTTLLSGSGAPNKPEEILALGDDLYVAANTEGILRLKNPSAAAPGAAWTDLGVGTTPAKWSAIDGYLSGSHHVIVVGNADPEQVGTSGRYTTVMKCVNAQAMSGFKWVNISSAETTTVKITLASGNGETYWRVDPAKGEGTPAGWAAQKRLDGNVFAIDQILIDPDNPNKIHAVGQMGIWRTLDGGATWEAADIGLGTAVHNAVAVDPARPGHVYVGDTDNGLWVSYDHAESVAYCTRPRSGTKPTVLDIDVDATTGLVYTAIDDIWRYDPVRRSWSRVEGANGKPLKDATGGKTPHGVEVERVSGSLVILAAVEHSGLWRLAADGDWVRASTGPNLDSPGKKGTPFEWPSSTSLVYFCDGHTGVWRSKDAGQNWTLIWKKTAGANPTGGLAVTSDTSRLFVTTKDGLYRLDHADTGDPVGSPGSTIIVNNLGVPNPGGLATQGGTLWVTGEASSSGTADVVLRKSTDGSTFTTFLDNYYEGAAGWPLGLAVEPGFQYTAATSMGTVVSER